ncbi:MULTISPECIES: O-antigen ligase family protein [unclassified Lentimonas]|uniref:O-antigen ligase family protein n=1 Tax=unclassified Lentimonas TaxID=2630993 RepID=UPI0013245488|nr:MULTISPECIES: O-antigen ligase family protein [unclassified Lentimonas]CAA6680035.1 Unannotated [Lentimonas sp. CC4]CAA6685155.1 Unannotated [Lentimonas sp. CC6]CAA7075119.1 Unannotated [Lentimonas sp. CC4]CAA7168421.1 Unannotated [Lentimonas sp. CC21]CAA7182144.1 Unannotated [Lentimonas sp. CC8]
MIKKFLIAIFCLSLPFTDAYIIHPYLPWPLIISLFMIFPYTVFDGQRKGKMFEGYDGLLVVGWAFGILAIVFSPVDFRYNNVSHTLVLPVVLLGYLFIPLRLISDEKDVSFLVRMFAFMLLWYGVFIVLEYISRNYFGGFYFNSIPHKSDLRNMVGRGWSGWGDVKEFYRPRGLSEESGHSSLIFELGMPVMLYVSSTGIVKSVYAYLIAALCAIAVFILGSSIGMITAPISIVIICIITRKLKLLISVCLLGAIALLIANFAFDGYLEMVIKRMFAKATTMLTGDGDIGSGLERRQAYINTFGLITNYPFGVGWGTTSIMGKVGYSKDSVIMYMGLLSLYSEWLVAVGVLGASVFLVYLFKLLGVVRKCGSYLLLAGLMALLLHYVIISNYWYPYLWISVLFIRLFARFPVQGGPRWAHLN